MVLSLVVVGPAGARAQPANPPDNSVAATPSSGAAREPRWSFTLGAQEAWDSNPLFETAQAEESFVGELGATLSYRQRGRRGEMTLAADGSGRSYHALKGEQGLNYGAGLTGRYRLSSRAQASVLGRLGRTYTRSSRELTEAGLLLPLSRARTVTSSGSLDLRLASTTSLASEIRYDDVRFDSKTLVGGSQLRATSTLSHTLGGNDSLRLSYSYRSDFLPQDTRQTHTVSTGWSGVLWRRVSAGASLGVNLARGESPSVGGSAHLVSRYQGGAVHLSYERSIGQAFGFGRQRLFEVAAASLNHTLNRRLDLGAALSHSHSWDSSDPLFRLSTQSGTAGIGFALNRQFRLAVRYTLDRGESGTHAPVLSHQALLSVLYGVQWR